MTAFLREALPVAVQACFAYLAITYLLFAAQLLVAAVENVRRFREERIEDYRLLASSRFTIPVSVIMPAYNEASVIVAGVRSALDFDYFEHEVIVVNDGSRDDTMAVLIAEFDLHVHQVFYCPTPWPPRKAPHGCPRWSASARAGSASSWRRCGTTGGCC